MQVTYNGLALYRYAPDTKAGDAKGQGAGGLWYVMNPSGKIVKTTPNTGTGGEKPVVGGGGGDVGSYYPDGIMDNGAGMGMG